MGHIGYRSIVGEISMNPYISGQNLAKFWGGGEEIYPFEETVLEERKNVPTKVGVRYPVQMLEDIKGVLDASTKLIINLKRVCKNYEFKGVHGDP